MLNLITVVRWDVLTFFNHNQVSAIEKFMMHKLTFSKKKSQEASSKKLKEFAHLEPKLL